MCILHHESDDSQSPVEVPGGPSRYANRIEIGRKSGKGGPVGRELGAGVRWTAARGIVGWSSNSGYSGSVTNWRGTEGRKPCYLLIATTLRAVLHR